MKIKTALFSCIILGIMLTQLDAQNIANRWIIGNFNVDFNTSPPNVNTGPFDFLLKGTASMCNQNGDLLFYSDGSSVWNRANEIMPNGQINFLDLRESIAVPHPGNSSQYYLFSVDPFYNQETSGLYYSIIDMTLDDGLGDVIVRNEKLVGTVSNKLSAVYNPDGNDYWVMVREGNSNRYFAFQITESGVNETPIISQLGRSITSSSDGQLKFSPDGKKVACGYGTFGTNGGLDGEGVQLFDFDIVTGQLTNDQLFLLPEDIRPIVGVEFSSDATKLFVYQSGSTHEQALYQYDITLAPSEIDASRQKVGESNSAIGEQLQLAPNGKIYMAKGGGQSSSIQYFGVINYPNESGLQTAFEELGLFLNGGASRLYMPNFVQSVFFKTDINFSVPCTGDTTTFRPSNTHRLESVLWQFGDGEISDEMIAKHRYQEEGTYTVRLLAFYPEKVDTIEKKIEIFPFTPFELGNDTTVCFDHKLLIDQKFESYQWNTGDTTKSIFIERTGTYALTITNEFGCLYKDSIALQVNDLPIINLPDSLGLGDLDSIELNPGNFETYIWNTGETTPTIRVGSRPAWYSVVVSDSTGCQSDHSVFVFPGEEPFVASESDWIRLNPKPSGFAGRDIQFIDDKIGFIVNQNEILQTKDGGKTWEKQVDIASGNRISFKNRVGYVVGNFGIVYKSTYSGKGWNRLVFPFGGNLNAITLIDQDSVFITSDNRLFSSFDGGQSWDAKPVGSVDIEDSFFTNTQTGYVVCKNGKILKTVDSGVNWYEVHTTTSFPNEFFSITFVNEEVGFASQEFHNIYKTIDGGETWNEIDAPFDAAYRIQFLDEQIGFFVGEFGVIYKTIDGGDTWRSIWNGARIAAYDLYGVYFIDEDRGFTTGQRGRILKTSNSGNTWEAYAPTYNTIAQLGFTSKNIGYARVGNHFFKTTDSGNSWLDTGAPLPDQKTKQFDFINDEVGFAIVGGSVGSSGTSGTIFKTIDGGINWSKAHESNQIVFDEIYCIDFVDENVGFACTSERYGGIHKTVDGGRTWRQTESTWFVQLQFLNAQLGYARKRYNTIYKTTNGGESWELVFEANEDINWFHFLNEEVGYFVGDDGLINKTTNGGESWLELDIPYEDYIYVQFYSRNFGYILDDEGQLYKTIDGGQSWERDLRVFRLRSINVQENDIYLAGDFGCIFKNSLRVEEIVDIRGPQITNLNLSHSAIQVNLRSSLDTTHFLFEYGLEPNRYDIAYFDTTYTDFVWKNLNFTLSGLEANTTYYGRFSVIEDGNSISSLPFSFKTLGFDDLILSNDVSTGRLDTSTTIRLELNSNLAPNNPIQEPSFTDLQFSIVPNPTRGVFRVIYSGSFAQLNYKITDATGEIQMQGDLMEQGSVLDISAFRPGIYFIIINAAGQNIIRRIVKQ